MQYVIAIALLVAVAVIAAWLRRRDDPEAFDRLLGIWVGPDAADGGLAAGDAPGAEDEPCCPQDHWREPWEPALDPTPPIGPLRWTVLVDTAWDARCTDADLLYLQAALWERGIPAHFLPCRPGDNFGLFGAQWPVRLLVDAGRADESRASMGDLLSLDPSENYQARLADPLLNVPGTREQLVAVRGMKRLAALKGGPYSVAWWCLWVWVVGQILFAAWVAYW